MIVFFLSEMARAVLFVFKHGRIACNSERCNTYSNSVCPSVRPSVLLSHAGTLSRRMKCVLSKVPKTL